MMDEVKIVESSKLQVFSNPSKIETLSRTLSGPTRVSLEFKIPQQKPLARHFPAQADIVRLLLNFVRILNLGPTARFLRDTCINTSTYISPLGYSIFLLNKLIFFILRGQTRSPLELPFQVLV
jgi:hypothetical protein